MFRIAIVEDSSDDAQFLIKMLNQYALEKQVEFTTDYYPAAEDFLKKYEYQYDMVFLDIRLPGISGMKAARQLRELDQGIQIVFLTRLAQYAVEGYEVDAADYIIKPLKYATLNIKLQRLLPKCNQSSGGILIEGDEQTVKIQEKDLIYIEIYDHHIHFVTQTGTIPAYGTLKELEPKLPPDFFRINNQTIINLRYVVNTNGADVTVKDRAFPISFRRRKDFIESLHNSGKAF